MSILDAIFGRRDAEPGRPRPGQPRRRKALGFWAARDNYLVANTAWSSRLILGEDRSRALAKGAHDAFGNGVSGEPEEALEDAEVGTRERESAMAAERLRRERGRRKG